MKIKNRAWEHRYTRNYLEKVIAIQKETMLHKRNGATQTWIFKNVVKPKYYIGKSAFDKALALNAKKLLKELYGE